MAEEARGPKYRDVDNLEKLRALSDELQSYEQEIRGFFDLAPDLLCTISWEVGDLPKNQMFDRVNPAWETILGYTVEEMTTEPYIMKVYEEDRGTEEELNRPAEEMSNERILQAVKEAEELGIKFRLDRSPMLESYVQRWYHKDGRVRYISWRATFDFINKRAYAIGRDVTDIASTDPESVLKMKHGLVMTVNAELDQIISTATNAKEKVTKVAAVIADEIASEEKKN